MNGEKSTLSSPHTSFAMKKVRTLQALLTQIHESYGLSSKSLVVGALCFGDTVCVDFSFLYLC
jgi:hypothetical protein